MSAKATIILALSLGLSALQGAAQDSSSREDADPGRDNDNLPSHRGERPPPPRRGRPDREGNRDHDGLRPPPPRGPEGTDFRDSERGPRQGGPRVAERSLSPDDERDFGPPPRRGGRGRDFGERADDRSDRDRPHRPERSRYRGDDAREDFDAPPPPRHHGERDFRPPGPPPGRDFEGRRHQHVPGRDRQLRSSDREGRGDCPPDMRRPHHRPGDRDRDQGDFRRDREDRPAHHRPPPPDRE